MKTIDKKLAELGPQRRHQVESLGASLIAQQLSLQSLRRARKLTQKSLAKQLGVGQDTISRLEKRSDLLLSTLRSYVEAMGGRLSLVAEFPDHPPVIVEGLAEPGARENP